jgi:hypothetical protein
MPTGRLAQHKAFTSARDGPDWGATKEAAPESARLPGRHAWPPSAVPGFDLFQRRFDEGGVIVDRDLPL